ncbi:MAG: ABC transporter substrate-binding protein [Acetobacteraceae bacterium]|nr:ABC transporter substrate-binding protein [Acetobacteraceae bacterium]
MLAAQMAIEDFNTLHPEIKVGLVQAQGIMGSMPFYWGMNDATKAFAARFMPRYHNAAPNYYHAGSYSAVTHYLKAVAAMGPAKAKASGRDTVAQMKAIPVDDPLFGSGHVRADGKHIHATYLWQTKAPSESKGEYGTTSDRSRPSRRTRPSSRWTR